MSGSPTSYRRPGPLVQKIRWAFLGSVLHGFAFGALAASELDDELRGWLEATETSSTTNFVLQDFRGIVEVFERNKLEPRLAHRRPPETLLPEVRARTRANARARVLNARLISALAHSSELRILPPDEEPMVRLDSGRLYYVSIGEEIALRACVKTPHGYFECHGTEFHVEVIPEENTTRVRLVEGAGELTTADDDGPLFPPEPMQSGDVLEIVDMGRPRPPPSIEALTDTIQWLLYYPGVLDLDDLPEATRQDPQLEDVMRHYRSGDLLRAMEAATNFVPVTNGEKVLDAALLLAVGEVPEAEKLLTSVLADANPGDRVACLAGGLRLLIQSVKLQHPRSRREPASPTEWLAESYYQQSLATDLATNYLAEPALRMELKPIREPWEKKWYKDRDSRLTKALKAATLATGSNTNFGFGWVRKAELEFSFGRLDRAKADLARVLDPPLSLSPRNPQALALRGFILAAENDVPAATNTFVRAISIDGALGNAWLGLGLSRIRLGDYDSALRYLQIAAAQEPHRSLLRSYLGKAYYDAAVFTPHPLATVKQLIRPATNQADRIELGMKELQMAKRLDTNDPTPYLYSAVILQQENRINEAVRELERSIELNDNRAVYRSRLLLDEDRAVRSANLASIYRDAGLPEVSFFEAARATESSYANYSAHLFLANTYDTLRDPFRVNLRYETPWINEMLLANLLAPVGAGAFSQNISQQEYSSLFDQRRHFGLISVSEYKSSGDWLLSASQHGILGSSSYSLDGTYRTIAGDRPNSDLRERELLVKLKQGITPDDTIFLQASFSDVTAGDVIQRYDPADADLDRRIEEQQDPFFLLGAHHTWAPGSHTLFFGAFLQAALQSEDAHVVRPVQVGVAGPTGGLSFDRLYENELDIFTAELQQIWETPKNTVVLGARSQLGEVASESTVTHAEVLPGLPSPVFVEPSSLSDPRHVSDVSHFSAYAYDYWTIGEAFLLTAGLSYDLIHYPLNYANPPLTAEDDTKGQVSPKAGLTWTIGPRTSVRASFAQSLTGLSFAQDFRVEPSHVAGLLQSFRGLIPESLGGMAPGDRLTMWRGAVDHQLETRTYLTIAGEWLRSNSSRSQGGFTADQFSLIAEPAQDKVELEYHERSLSLSANQLLGSEWAAGARYRLSHAEFEEQFKEAPRNYELNTDQEAILHSAELILRYQHASGFFGLAEAEGRFQTEFTDHTTRAENINEPNDTFWQFNFFTGYRFPHRRAELTLGILNIFDQDYRLHPINFHLDLPRERTLAVRLSTSF